MRISIQQVFYIYQFSLKRYIFVFYQRIAQKYFYAKTLTIQFETENAKEQNNNSIKMKVQNTDRTEIVPA